MRDATISGSNLLHEQSLQRLRDAAIGMAGATLHAWNQYRRRREARATRAALSELDDHTLRDLGFHRSEIGSIAAEAAGLRERTRIRTLIRPRAPS